MGEASRFSFWEGRGRRGWDLVGKLTILNHAYILTLSRNDALQLGEVAAQIGDFARVEFDGFLCGLGQVVSSSRSV